MHGRRWNRIGRLTAALGAVVLSTIVPSALGGSGAYTYDQLRRATTALYDDGTCIVYSYDANGNRTSQSITNAAPPESPTWGTGTFGCFHWTAQ